MKLAEDLENIVNDYKKLNDQTYITASEQSERNYKKLVELDNKIKIEWKNTVKSFWKSEGKFASPTTSLSSCLVNMSTVCYREVQKRTNCQVRST